MSRRVTVLKLWGCIAATIVCWSSPDSTAEDQFRSKVVPILREKCVHCHNDRDRDGELSLQSRTDVFDNELVSPGNAVESRLLEVITPVDGEAEMPQNGAPLSVDERLIIERWIEAGAEWPEDQQIEPMAVSDYQWWSYQPLQPVTVPRGVVASDENPIDAFVRRKLIAKGLEPSAPADARTLIRRLTYDLTGLPPTPEEVDKFVQDERLNAYERLVERLLASPQYGERWARHWLDVARYADTCGYDKDKLRPNSWPYRDYVIRSFNEDKPYSRFVKEQVAGDVLFPDTPDGILGLGFIAAGPWDFIGHVEVPESKIDGKVARNLDRDDMVSNVINTFCSLTVQCARCHNHKFDPITQEHYYGLQAIFADLDRADRPFDLDPAIQQRRRELTERLRQLEEKSVELERKLVAAVGVELTDLDETIENLRGQQKVRKNPAYGFHSRLESTADVEKWVELNLRGSVEIAEITLRPCHDDYAGLGAGFGFPVRFRVDAVDDEKTTTLFEQMDSDFPNPGLTALVIPVKGLRARKVVITVSKLSERKDDFMFALAEVEIRDTRGEVVSQDASVDSSDSIEAPVRWARRNLTDGLWASPADPMTAAQLAKAESERRQLLKSNGAREILKSQAEVKERKSDVESEIAKLPKGNLVYAAATDFKPRGNFKPTKGKLRPIRVLHRGNIQQPGATAVPGYLPMKSADDYEMEDGLSGGERRAALAEWLTSQDHPLVWRSIVNRIWQYHFGRGLVETPNDFGRMGAEPTHPELLDWLAVHFRDNGQSIKDLHRLIVTSRTYRQASSGHAGNSKIDGENRFLWRMNRRRLQAEEIRDTILFVSGSLNEKMGGPGFYLFELEKADHSPHFEYHKFDPAASASHRRSIYRFIVRSQPDPWMTAFDCADSSQSTPRRNETLTPLQALSLLNDKFNLTMAEKFAARLRMQSNETETQVRNGFRLAIQRDALPSELQTMAQYAQEHGLENFCRLLFNLNELIFVD